MSSLDNGFDFCAFIDEGVESQSKYDRKANFPWTAEEMIRIDHIISVGGKETFEHFGPAMDFRHQKVIEYLGHMLEESFEARAYVPRRAWKNNEPSFMDNDKLRSEFTAELFDILLFFRAVCAYAGISGQEILDSARAKLAYNSVRKDHAINGDESAPSDPVAELRGDCPSSGFATPQEEEALDFIETISKLESK